ncbi:hypothetical protein FLONG3_5213 [Fusarium longipes]|uniref:Apple domain-containing protein n=1 Tax=Fusarium longipes TaxID=694270 RepID=A0A395SWW9_9HYPO|nr:hypothetical protein FLONG3_5213 [Fusarium longipes]
MSRFSLLAASVAVLALSGVNAGPCRPVTSVITSLETATTSIEASESTPTLEPTATTETVVIETSTVAVSTSETAATSVETTETVSTVDDSTTIELPTTTDVPTTIDAPTTTTETATSVSATSAAPDSGSDGSCASLSNPYTSPDGIRFEPRCRTGLQSPVTAAIRTVDNFEDCVMQCANVEGCNAVMYIESIQRCYLITSWEGTYDAGLDSAIVI